MKNNTKPLKDIEIELILMASQYACKRQSIPCFMLPKRIIEEYWNRMSDHEKKLLSEVIKRECDLTDTQYFSDRDVWEKFAAALDTEKHYEVECIDDTKYVVFSANNKIYPLNSYIQKPHSEIYFPNNAIKKK